MTAMRLLLAVLLCATVFAASAQMYRWTDEKGRVHYTSTPPPPGAKGVQKKDATRAAPEAAAPGLPYAVQQAQKNYPVTLYTAPGCEGCDAARKLLNARGIPFREVSVVENAQIAELKTAVGSNSVPAMLVGRSVVTGFEAGGYNRALDAAGYPRAGILPPRTQSAPKPAAAAQAPAAEREPLTPASPRGRYSTPTGR